MSALAPADLGLPAKFVSFRGGQDDCAITLASSTKRFSLLSAPTGTGKSLIYLSAAKMLNARALVLVGTKGLQAQLMHDFGSAGLVDMRGQSNYTCVAVDGGDLSDYGKPGTGCDEGPCKIGVFCSLKQDGGCLYYDAQRAARDANLVVTNYAYWMALGRHSDPMALGEFDLLILDEAHSAPEWLSEFCAVQLDRREMKSLLSLELPPINEGVAVWSEWAKGAAVHAKDRYTEVRQRLLDGNRKIATAQALRLSALIRDLTELAHAHQWRSAEGPRRDVRMPGLQMDWVAEANDHGVRFSPVWAHGYAEQYLFRGIPRVLLASATLSPDVRRYLGIDKRDADYHEVGSGFDPKRRPFIYVPTTRVDRGMLDGQVRIWTNRIDAIIGQRLDRKGIIHTRSYQRARDIVLRSRHSDIMLTHTTNNARETIAAFKRAPAPCVLVSPSVEEGFDFPGDECRYQIIAKVPFIDGRGAITKARAKSDRGFLNYVAALSLVQMVGRGMRSLDDYCETFIIDDHWAWFRRSAVFPRWFKQAWVQSSTIPAPAPLQPARVRVKPGA